MSRIVVKNLPTKVSEEELRQYFSKYGTVTDLKLKYRNGEFRRFGFVGFCNAEEAEKSCSYFNGSFFKQSRITVEICQDIVSDNKPQPWSKKSKEKIKAEENIETESKKGDKKKKKKKEKEESVIEKLKDDSKFTEFLKLKEKGLAIEEEKEISKSRGSSSDDEDSHEEEIGSKNEEQSTDEEEENEDKIANKKEISDMDYLKLMKKKSVNAEDKEGTTKTKKKKKEWKEFFTIVIRSKEMCKAKTNQKRTFNKKSIKAFLQPLKYKSLRIPRNVRLVAYVGFATEKDMKQALQKDKSFLDGVRVQVHKFEKPDEGPTHNNAPWSAAEEKLKSAEPVAESGKIFARNLWYSVTEDDLRELFEEYGNVTDINLPICKISRKPKGFATITFLFAEHAVRAMSELDGKNFKGRVLHLMPAIDHEKENKKETEGGSYKEQKAKELKATAGSWHNWNTLFIGTGAVVDIMAEKYNRSKMEILDNEGKQSAAVNLALGEAQIVDETKRCLEENGISLEAFSREGIQRSNTVMLVKNLPSKTTARELSELFGRFGELGRVVLPPSGVTAIIEFLDSSEAKNAFKNLAYSKFKYLPLYLEWAPVDTFKTAMQMTDKKETKEETADVNEEQEDNADTALSETPENDTCLYVKNLSFSTDEELLKQHFEHIGPIYSVLIAKQRGLSRGYGFVQFMKRKDTQKALKDMQESVLEEHTLQLRLSEKTLSTKIKSARKMHDAGKQTSKLLVKNVPFQATLKEIRQLFRTFGELKSVRLPGKIGSTEHRGFGFVEFITKEDAKKAFDALGGSTHLYGRRLVLEWAKEEETVEELRRKTAEHFLASGPPKKKSKIDVSMQEDVEAS
ncbi:putative RNA-binding protein 19 [Oratosquilla oratoria]|uniref:putative RNA-binding protein 19 n=1 Tax=Oratosquilla oratoria TaxID=337810 RepID=UPI003F76D882